MGKSQKAVVWRWFMLTVERIADVHLYHVYATVNSICTIEHIHEQEREREREGEMEGGEERERERERERETHLVIIASQIRYEPHVFRSYDLDSWLQWNGHLLLCWLTGAGPLWGVVVSQVTDPVCKTNLNISVERGHRKILGDRVSDAWAEQVKRFKFGKKNCGFCRWEQDSENFPPQKFQQQEYNYSLVNECSARNHESIHTNIADQGKLRP